MAMNRDEEVQQESNKKATRKQQERGQTRLISAFDGVFDQSSLTPLIVLRRFNDGEHEKKNCTSMAYDQQAALWGNGLMKDLVL
jgi:deoxyinosine 3'endonuclease (endonuclease V)